MSSIKLITPAITLADLAARSEDDRELIIIGLIVCGLLAIGLIIAIVCVIRDKPERPDKNDDYIDSGGTPDT